MKLFYVDTDEKSVACRKELLSVWLNGTVVGIPIVLMTMLMSSWWPYVFRWVVGLFGIPLTDAAEWVSTAIGQQVLQIAVSAFAFVVPFLLLALIFPRPIKKILPFTRPQGPVGALFCMALGFCAFADIAVSGMQQFFEQFHVHYSVSYHDEPEGFLGIVLCVLATGIVPAVVEEFACRGVIYGLAEPHGEEFAVVVSAAVFGLMHSNFEQIPFAFLVGLALGFVRAKTGSMWLCMAIHSANNMISVIISKLRPILPEGGDSLLMWTFLTVSMVLALVSVFRLRKAPESFYRFKKSGLPVTGGERLITYFLSPTVLWFTAYCIVQSFRYFV